MLNKLNITIALILPLHILILIFTKFTLWPEMVVYPFLLNKGLILYKEIINPYPPFLIYLLSVFSKIFGYNPIPYRILTIAVILLIDLVIFYIAKSLFGKKYAVYSIVIFALFTVPFGANGLWFDLIQTPVILISIVYFFRFIKNKKPKISDLFISSALLSTAFFIKQQTLWIFLLYFAAIFALRKKIAFTTSHSILFLPILVPFLIQLLFFQLKGSLNDYWQWVYLFPFLKASSQPGYILLPTNKELIVLAAFLTAYISLPNWKSPEKYFFPITSLTLLLFAYPRFDYFHLVPFIAVYSIILPKNVEYISHMSIKLKALAALSCLIVLLFTSRYYFLNFGQKTRFFEMEIYQLSHQLNGYIKENDLIYLQNAPDQTLALTNIKPVSPWADEFPWYLENNDLQINVVEALSKKKPKYVLFKEYEPGSKYQLGAYKPQKIVDYIDMHYKKDIYLTNGYWIKTRIENER